MTDKVIEKKVLTTKDYNIFKEIKGNRDINKSRVTHLKKLMEKNGNRTDILPVIVNSKMQVLDGQHRLEALKQLGWEVGYVVETGNIETVRAINQGAKAWNWRDIATSYMKSGNKNYSNLLWVIDHYKLRFNPALRLVSVEIGNDRGMLRSRFYEGELASRPIEVIADEAAHVNEVTAHLKDDRALVQSAIIRLMRHPEYDTKRMARKAEQHGRISEFFRESDYLRELEDMYNNGYHEDNRVRLF